MMNFGLQFRINLTMYYIFVLHANITRLQFMLRDQTTISDCTNSSDYNIRLHDNIQTTISDYMIIFRLQYQS